MTASEWILIIGIFGAYLLAIFSPLIVALSLALRSGSTIPRRWVFVLVATALSYGAALFAYLVVAVPVRLFAVYAYPSLVAADNSRISWEPWILPLDRLGEFPQYLLPIMLLVVACTVIVYVWRRWPAIANALA